MPLSAISSKARSFWASVYRPPLPNAKNSDRISSLNSCCIIRISSFDRIFVVTLNHWQQIDSICITIVLTAYYLPAIRSVLIVCLICSGRSGQHLTTSAKSGSFSAKNGKKCAKSKSGLFVSVCCCKWLGFFVNGFLIRRSQVRILSGALGGVRVWRIKLTVWSPMFVIPVVSRLIKLCLLAY